MEKTNYRNAGLLVITALIWGVAFVAQTKGGDAIGPYSFCCIRFFLGAAVLLPVIAVFDKLGVTKNKPKTKADKKQLWAGGIICGTFLCLMTVVQQVGLYLGVPVGKAGFLTTCYIILVPIFGIFLKKKCGWNIWIAVVITLGGLYLLCMKESFSLQKRDILILICSALCACQILAVDYYAPNVDVVRMSCIQSLTAGIISAIPMFLVEMDLGRNIVGWLSSLASWNAWIPILYAGILSSGGAYTLQIVGQKGVKPAVASLIMSLESVFSVFAGLIFLGQKLSARELFGCALIFVAVVLAQIPFKTREK